MLRLFAAALFLVLAIVFAFAVAPLAFAQESAPAAPPVGAEGIIGLVRDSFTAALMAIATGAVAWLSTKASSWLGGRIDLNSTLDSLHWEEYLKTASANAFAYAQARVGLTPEKIATIEQKSDFLGAAFRFLAAHNRDIVDFADANGNGVIDILETQLAKLNPGLPMASEAPGLAPPRRAVRSPAPPTPRPVAPRTGISTPEEVARRLSPKKPVIQ